MFLFSERLGARAIVSCVFCIELDGTTEVGDCSVEVFAANLGVATAVKSVGILRILVDGAIEIRDRPIEIALFNLGRSAIVV